METAAGEAADAGEALSGLPAQLATHADFSEVLASLANGQAGTLGGVWGSSRALVAAALARVCPGPLVVVAPHFGEIDAIERDLALFTDLPVSVFPAWESEPGERVLHDEIFGERLRVLKALRGARSEEREARSEKREAWPSGEIFPPSHASRFSPLASRP